MVLDTVVLVLDTITKFIGLIFALVIYLKLKERLVEAVIQKRFASPTIISMIDIAIVLLMLSLIFNIVPTILDLARISFIESKIIKDIGNIITSIFVYYLIFLVVMATVEIIPSINNLNLPFIKELNIFFIVLVLFAGFLIFVRFLISGSSIEYISKFSYIFIFSFSLILYPFLLSLIKQFAENYLNLISNILNIGQKEIIMNIILIIFSISYLVGMINILGLTFPESNLENISSFLNSTSSALGNIIWYTFIFSLTLAALYFIQKR